MKDDLTAHYRLMNDIDVLETSTLGSDRACRNDPDGFEIIGSDFVWDGTDLCFTYREAYTLNLSE